MQRGKVQVDISITVKQDDGNIRLLEGDEVTIINTRRREISGLIKYIDTDHLVLQEKNSVNHKVLYYKDILMVKERKERLYGSL